MSTPSVAAAATAAASSSAAANPARVKPEPTKACLPGPSAQKRQRTGDGPAARAPPVPVQHVGPSSAPFDDGGGPSDPYGAEPQAGMALLPSFFRVEPYDEMQRRIGEWIRNVSRGHSHIEIEAKIGQMIHPQTQRRLVLPFETEAILTPSANPHNDPTGLRYVFESDMPASQHKHFNQLLNQETQSTRKMPHPVKYTHVYETDVFRKVGNKKVRIRKDKKTNAVVQVCEKIRLGDLNISSPMSKFDWRLSVSTETPMDYVPEGPDLNMRTKDRLSYTHQIVQVDLTQVSTEDGKRRHELEVEVVDVDTLLAEAAAAEREENNCYEHLVGVLVSSVRLLIRNAAA